jgi:hypothetical protein
MNQNMAPRTTATTAADPTAVPAIPPAESFPELGFPELAADAVLSGTVVEVLVARPPVVEEQNSSTTWFWVSTATRSLLAVGWLTIE